MLVSTEPETDFSLALGLERMIENERVPSKAEDEALWLKRTAEIDLEQEHLLDLRLDGDITPEQFRARSTELRSPRCGAGSTRSLPFASFSPQRPRTQQRHTRLTLRISRSCGTGRTPLVDRNKIYEMMHLRVFAHPDYTLIAEWGCNDEPLPPGSFKITTPSFKLRALLTEGGDPRVQIHRA
jgi:hypothetical protein